MPFKDDIRHLAGLKQQIWQKMILLVQHIAFHHLGGCVAVDPSSNSKLSVSQSACDAMRRLRRFCDAVVAMELEEFWRVEFDWVLDDGCCAVRSSDSTMKMCYIKRVPVPQVVSLILPTSSRLQYVPDHPCTLYTITALHGMQRGLTMRFLSVRLSVCLSNACIVTKRKKAMFRFLYHMKDHLS